VAIRVLASVADVVADRKWGPVGCGKACCRLLPRSHLQGRGVQPLGSAVPEAERPRPGLQPARSRPRRGPAALVLRGRHPSGIGGGGGRKASVAAVAVSAAAPAPAPAAAAAVVTAPAAAPTAAPAAAPAAAVAAPAAAPVAAEAAPDRPGWARRRVVQRGALHRPTDTCDAGYGS
jgi:hypothetical protein